MQDISEIRARIKHRTHDGAELDCPLCSPPQEDSFEEAVLGLEEEPSPQETPSPIKSRLDRIFK